MSAAHPTPEERLVRLGLHLPTLSEPRGNYVRARRHGDLLFLAGHGPPPDAHGVRPSGRVGSELTPAQGYASARGAGLALLATMKSALGDLARVSGILRVFGMVRCADGFDATPQVIDGCSDLFVEVFGPEIGAHVRTAVGVAVLPFGLPVEIEAIVAVRD